MKVIKKGREQKGWAKEFECTGNGNGNGGCGAILLVEEEDIVITHNNRLDGGKEYFSTFECCECGVKTDPPKEDVPGFIFRKAQDNPKKHKDTL